MRRFAVVAVVLGLALGLWFWTERGEDPRAGVSADLEQCTEHLRHLYQALLAERQRTGALPAGSGVALFGGLIASGDLADTPENRRWLTCPGPGAEPVGAHTDYRDPATLDAGSSAYAGRDQVRHPLLKFPAGGSELEPLIACDNAHGLNHAGAMNLLRTDGSVVVLTLERLIAEGVLPAGATTIPVGPDSPVPELAKLTQGSGD